MHFETFRIDKCDLITISKSLISVTPESTLSLYCFKPEALSRAY